MPSNKETATRWFVEVWNGRNTAIVEELAVPDCVGHNMEGPDVTTRGLPAFLDFHKRICAAIPDLAFEIQDTIAEDDRVVVRLRMQGTHTGDQLGLPPTGNHIDFEAVIVLRFENYKLVEAWNYVDQLTFYQQLRILNVH